MYFLSVDINANVLDRPLNESCLMYRLKNIPKTQMVWLLSFMCGLCPRYSYEFVSKHSIKRENKCWQKVAIFATARKYAYIDELFRKLRFVPVRSGIGSRMTKKCFCSGSRNNFGSTLRSVAAYVGYSTMVFTFFLCGEYTLTQCGWYEKGRKERMVASVVPTVGLLVYRFVVL